MQAGDTVTYMSYDQLKTGVISHLSRDGKVVFLVGGKWLHRVSVLAVNGKLV
jgi:hypothetical protein